MKVEVVEYNTQWPELFKIESQKIATVFEEELVSIHHIGSTSVEGLTAKPIIDIMPVVKTIENVDALSTQMNEIGYEALGEFGMKGRRYFRKGEQTRTHHIHVFEEGNSYDIGRHLAVRDYLRLYPEESKLYGDLKMKLASMFPNDIESYIDGKDLFVKELERKALSWYDGKE
ncbi:hypothetical protein CSV80_05990 [Sporosarcina sp. P12(2017)]|uniref:GrpB family protein n=1 Tax=unclassified Sporosarcina TaxID=2647733 RepID=UPI000C168FC7|nr:MULTISPECIES: GrpB family protein [unclassified Sporosarcina]PIC57859.1 hypothetical protein CSV81_06135 [Sporosarcina sp. P10]PIC61241.1 hypothetical protein CSV80_05990 [Sporosarcina sp. P12(2017)]